MPTDPVLYIYKIISIYFIRYKSYETHKEFITSGDNQETKVLSVTILACDMPTGHVLLTNQIKSNFFKGTGGGDNKESKFSMYPNGEKPKIIVNFKNTK